MKRTNVMGGALSLIILFAIGCQQLQNHIKTEPDPDADAPVSISVDDVVPIASKKIGTVVMAAAGTDAVGKWGDDAYELSRATITDDTLTITVSYGGGCEAHQFTLVASDSFLDSFPVQLNVSLAHNANGDACEAWITEAYHFDLTPIKTLYQEVYRQEVGTIILRLENSPTEELVYEFAM